MTNSSHLPLVAVVRSAMAVASTQEAAATPLDRKCVSDGLSL